MNEGIKDWQISRHVRLVIEAVARDLLGRNDDGVEAGRGMNVDELVVVRAAAVMGKDRPIRFVPIVTGRQAQAVLARHSADHNGLIENELSERISGHHPAAGAPAVPLTRVRTAACLGDRHRRPVGASVVVGATHRPAGA